MTRLITLVPLRGIEPLSTCGNTGSPAVSLRLVPIQSRSLPAVLFWVLTASRATTTSAAHKSRRDNAARLVIVVEAMPGGVRDFP